MVISMKDKAPTWHARKRHDNEYWSGRSGAEGWCIFTAPRTLGEGYYIGQTNMNMPVRFGPFDSFDAAKAAFTLMGDTLKQEIQNEPTRTVDTPV